MVLVGATVFVGAAVVGDDPAVAEAALTVAATVGAAVAGAVAAARGVGVLPVGALVAVDTLVVVDALVVGFVVAVAGAVVAGVAIPDGVTLLLLEPSEQAVRTTAMSVRQMSGRIRNRRTIRTCSSRGKPHRPSSCIIHAEEGPHPDPSHLPGGHPQWRGVRGEISVTIAR
jgi:hypothetical protein